MLEGLVETNATSFWGACRVLNSSTVGAVDWEESFKALVQMASENTAIGKRARAFLLDQCGVTITIESSAVSEYLPRDLIEPAAAVGANDL